MAKKRPKPFRPTTAPPRSAAKLKAMKRRLNAEQPLFHANDAKGDPRSLRNAMLFFVWMICCSLQAAPMTSTIQDLQDEEEITERRSWREPTGQAPDF